MRLARQLVALGLFLADRQQPDARPLDAQPRPRVDRAHHAELQQMRRLALDRRARVDQHRRPVPRRHRRRQRRTIDAGQHAERARAPPHRGAGVPGATSAAASPRATSSAATRIDARGLRRSASAGDSAISTTSGASITRMSSASGRRGGQLRFDRGTAADEIDADAQMPRGGQRAVDDARRRMIAAHRVDRYAHAGPRLRDEAGVTLFLVDRRDLALLVEAAVLADAVRRLRLAALRAVAGRGRGQRVVRAALAAAGLGVASFWIRHRLCPGSSALSARQPGIFPATWQSHVASFRLVPQFGHSPLQSARHSGFIGSAR